MVDVTPEYKPGIKLKSDQDAWKLLSDKFEFGHATALAGDTLLTSRLMPRNISEPVHLVVSTQVHDPAAAAANKENVGGVELATMRQRKDGSLEIVTEGRRVKIIEIHGVVIDIIVTPSKTKRGDAA